MKDTICEAGGSLQVMSAPGQGTTVIARFGPGFGTDRMERVPRAVSGPVTDDVTDEAGVPQPVP
jgi:hypothetical protein